MSKYSDWKYRQYFWTAMAVWLVVWNLVVLAIILLIRVIERFGLFPIPVLVIIGISALLSWMYSKEQVIVEEIK